MDESQYNLLKSVIRPIIWQYYDDGEYRVNGISVESFTYNSVVNYLGRAVREVINEEYPAQEA